MSGTVRFSVIMGVYNPAGRRLFEAVESIVRQTAADWELLLLDDGSAEGYRPLIRRPPGWTGGSASYGKRKTGGWPTP